LVRIKIVMSILIFSVLYVGMSYAQVGVFTKEDIMEYTSLWKGERFPDGRPKVSDDLLKRLEKASIEQAWGVCKGDGFNQQYVGDLKCTQPGKVLVGRAVTAVYMPRRPDMRKVMDDKGSKEGRIGDQISWPIDVLIKGDIYVADTYGLVENGPIIGDNLATSIFAKSGKGVVFDGSLRDLEGIKENPDFVAFVRGWHPSFSSPDIMLMGINCPIRIGKSTVMPGDVVLGKEEGVIFIPPHLVEKVVKTAEIVNLRDQFGHERLKEQKYTSGQIDSKWSDEIERDFSKWLNDHMDQLTVPKADIQEYLKKRTW
jgi:4-hydroxy-4-methyl-2-oxoglutarate aldolase